VTSKTEEKSNRSPDDQDQHKDMDKMNCLKGIDIRINIMAVLEQSNTKQSQYQDDSFFTK
jgi:hypothetical protein